MSSQISGTVTRKSNGSLEFTPADAGTFNQLPAMGDEVSVSFDVTRTAAQIERAHAAAKRARMVDGVAESTVGGVPIGEGVQVDPGSPPMPPVERRVRK